MLHRTDLIMVPDDRGRDRTFVWHRTAGGGSDRLLGHVHDTAGAGAVATWVDADGNDLIGMTGFMSLDAAAETLYWFAPPSQSLRSVEAVEAPDTWVSGTITFRAPTINEAVTTVIRAIGPLRNGERDFINTSQHHDVQLSVRHPA